MSNLSLIPLTPLKGGTFLRFAIEKSTGLFFTPLKGGTFLRFAIEKSTGLFFTPLKGRNFNCKL